MPQALRDSLAAAGVAITDDIAEAAAVLVGGTLAPKSRRRYGSSLSIVARWCAEHGLDLMHLSALDIAALAVAMRDSGLDPRETLGALSFTYRHKREPCESATALARRVDKVWRAQNREQLTPSRRAPVLPLRCWAAMHEAVGRPGYIRQAHDLNEERVARDKLVISLGVPGGLRAGELGLLSASRSRIDHHSRLVLPLVAGAVTKSGRSEIVVPVAEPPFDALPLGEDFERLRALRVARSGDDHLFAGAWHYGMSGGLTTCQVQYLLRKMADKAHIAEGVVLAGHSMRRSMIHISAAAGWPLERIAAVLGHASTREIETRYLEGYGGSWTTGKGRGLLLEGSDGWADWPINAPAHVEPDPDGPALPPRWWAGRDLDADRATATALARSTARVSREAASIIARAGGLWRSFCDEVHADAARPSQHLITAFAASLTKDSTTNRANDIRHLKDHFASLEAIAVEDLARIERWVSAAAALAEKATAANRRRCRTTPRRRAIVVVTDDMMSRIFAAPLANGVEAVRLSGLVLEQGKHHIDLTWRQRARFRFGEHVRVTPEAAELLVPTPVTADAEPGHREPAAAITVAPRGGDPLWCGYEAALSLAARYPDRSLYSKVAPGERTARCAPLLRWLEARAAAAVLHATGLRPTDLDAFRWPDLARGTDGSSIMWRLPYSKGNMSGGRVQVLRLVPSDQPWCPVRALERLAGSLTAVRDAGWADPAYGPDSSIGRRWVFSPRIGRELTRILLEPAGVAVRPQDFRYRTAARVWAATQDIQAVKATLFHRQAETSAIYVARGMPSETRRDTDPLSGVFESAERHGSPRAATNHKDR